MAGAEHIAELRRPGAFSTWPGESCDRLSVALHALVRLADHSMQRYAHPPPQHNAVTACEAADCKPRAGERDAHAERLEQAAYVRLGEQSLLRGMKRAALLRLMRQVEAGRSEDEGGSEGPSSDEEGPVLMYGGGDESDGESDESEVKSKEALAPGFGPGGGEAAQQAGAGSQLACEVHGSLHRPADEDLSHEQQVRKKPKL